VLEPLELAGGHEHLGVQREAVVVGAQRSRQRRRARRAALAQMEASLAKARAIAAQLGEKVAKAQPPLW
jgi:hypothetical protein